MRIATTCFFISILLFSGSCASKGKTELSRALATAVKDKKISSKKMENVLEEYQKLRDDDRKRASEYALQVLGAIEMGGDSTHIDAARKTALRRTGAGS